MKIWDSVSIYIYITRSVHGLLVTLCYCKEYLGKVKKNKKCEQSCFCFQYNLITVNEDITPI